MQKKTKLAIDSENHLKKIHKIRKKTLKTEIDLDHMNKKSQ